MCRERRVSWSRDDNKSQQGAARRRRDKGMEEGKSCTSLESQGKVQNKGIKKDGGGKRRST